MVVSPPWCVSPLQISEKPSVSPIAPKGFEAVAEFPVSPTSLHSLCLLSPERFSRESGYCHPFIPQCELHLQFNNTADWATEQPDWSSHISGYSSVELTISRNFLKYLHQYPREAAKALVCFRLSKRSVIDYAVEFCTISAEINHQEHTFLNSSSKTRKDNLAPLDLPADLNAVINLAFI